MTPFLGEFIGTALLVTLGDGVVANVVLNKTKGNNSGWIVIAFGWAMAVYVGVFVSAPYSGAHLNPAVTLSLAVAGKFEWASVTSYILAQLAGALVGALVVWITYRQHFNETDDANSKLAVFCTAPAIRSPVNNFITELIGTFVLVFAVLYIANPTINFNNTDGKMGLGAIGSFCLLRSLFLRSDFHWAGRRVMRSILQEIWVRALCILFCPFLKKETATGITHGCPLWKSRLVGGSLAAFIFLKCSDGKIFFLDTGNAGFS